jgi:cell division protease FtsH
MVLKRLFLGWMLAILLVLVLLIVVLNVAGSGTRYTTVRISQVASLLDRNQVKSAIFHDNTQVIQVTTKTGHYLEATWVDGQALQLANQMSRQGIPYEASNPHGSSLLSVILGWLPFIVIFLLFFVVLGQVRAGRRQGSWWRPRESPAYLDRPGDRLREPQGPDPDTADPTAP